MICFRCGICCHRYQVQLSMTEASRIAAGLGLSLEEFADRCADRRWPGTTSILLRQHHGVCIFLEQTDSSKETCCLIHHLKPSVCREWSANPLSSECREGLAKYWELTVSPSGQLEGAEEKLSVFYSFLQSVK